MYYLPEESKQPHTPSDTEEEKRQMLSLYILPLHRGKGLAKGLCQATFDWLLSRTDVADGSQFRVRIMIKSGNTATYSLYEKLGFEMAGMCTLAEALKANGDAELIPGDGGGKKYSNRSGLIMTVVLQK